MEETKKSKLDYSAATILALAVFVIEIYAGIFGSGEHGSWRLFYSAAACLWFLACLLRNNKIACRLLATAGFLCRIVFVASVVLNNVSDSLILSAPCCLDIIFNVVLILCIWNVIKNTEISVMILWAKIILTALIVLIVVVAFGLLIFGGTQSAGMMEGWGAVVEWLMYAVAMIASPAVIILTAESLFHASVICFFRFVKK